MALNSWPEFMVLLGLENTNVGFSIQISSKIKQQFAVNIFWDHIYAFSLVKLAPIISISTGVSCNIALGYSNKGIWLEESTNQRECNR